MSRTYLYVAAAIAVVAAMFIVTISEDTSADATYEVDGKVVAYNGDAIKSVQVTIICNDVSCTPVYTNDSGQYAVKNIPSNTGLKIRFVYSGMTVTEFPDCMTLCTDGFTLDLSGMTPVGNTYTLDDVGMMVTYLSGYVMNEASSGNTPLSCEMTLSDYSGQTYTATSDKSTGAFTIPIGSTTGLSLYIDAAGYTPVPGIFFMTNYVEDGKTIVKFDLSGEVSSLGASYKVNYTDDSNGIRTYSLPKDFPILMSASTGSLVVYVYDTDGKPLREAQVTLTSQDIAAKKYTGTSDTLGCVTINGISTGDYDMSVKVSGFKEREISDVTIAKGSNSVDNVVMNEKSSHEYFGMDLRHLMTIIGVILGLLIVMVLLVVVVRNRHRIKLDD